MMSLKPIVRIYIAKIRPNAQDELDWFRQQPTLQSAIEFAALATDKRGKRYAHQRRLKKTSLERARQVLLTNAVAIGKSRSFDDLFALIDAMLEPIEGIGELYVYDTALRIGARLNLLPTKVYLHAGTRKGARALGFDGKVQALEVTALPSDLHVLDPHEIEDVLCIFEDKLKAASIGLAEDEITRRSCFG
jgi:hypothetical protein